MIFKSKDIKFNFILSNYGFYFEYAHELIEMLFYISQGIQLCEECHFERRRGNFIFIT